jgi:hypothetical protein
MSVAVKACQQQVKHVSSRRTARFQLADGTLRPANLSRTSAASQTCQQLVKHVSSVHLADGKMHLAHLRRRCSLDFTATRIVGKHARTHRVPVHALDLCMQRSMCVFVCVCVRERERECVCVCVRERERERERERDMLYYR